MFARATPEQKSRLIKVARRRGTDVAKDAADVVLLDKDLGVLAEGVMEGRRIVGNTIKYALMATSSNFGTMFSAAVSSSGAAHQPPCRSRREAHRRHGAPTGAGDTAWLRAARLPFPRTAPS